MQVNSIEGVPLGTVDKILLKFPHKWWPDNVKDISFLWAAEERMELVKELPKGPTVDGRLGNGFMFVFVSLLES